MQKIFLLYKMNFFEDQHSFHSNRLIHWTFLVCYRNLKINLCHWIFFSIGKSWKGDRKDIFSSLFLNWGLDFFFSFSKDSSTFQFSQTRWIRMRPRDSISCSLMVMRCIKISWAWTFEPNSVYKKNICML